MGYGDSIATISFSNRIGESTVRKIIYDTCRALWEVLQPIYMPQPTEEQWKRVEEKYWQIWNYPNCIGALDGKHCVFEKPPKTGSMYFNYKKEFSIVLLALVDADYKFISVDIGAYGRNSDGGVFKSSSLGQALANGSLNIPPPKPLPHSDVIVPHVIVCDEAFPLTPNTMRPFPGKTLENNRDNKVYNYRHCRARRVVENAFGILAKKFKIYNRKFNFKPEHMDIVVMATTVLHNFLRNDNCHWQPGELEETTPTRGLNNFTGVGGNNPREAYNIRENFKQFFVSDNGSVPWQWEKACT